ncbi:hypothetical protein pdam_00005140 [Pocillopora damicornis]|uniref:Uncharacterized protein n=1 Tax=Pocillopora damicornis TaxID=46731 RepID=A0A3M6TNI2_POCDA|nr:hypothetical protein pdam_00005140 [Pocillopora damicornis]
MRNLELGNETEKDVFNLVTSAEQREKCYSLPPNLGVNKTSSALLYVILSPVGPYFKTGTFSPVALLADPSFVRAWPGGVGDCKMGGNYGPTILAQRHAEMQGLQQVLWLYGEERQITEVGTMNIFMFWINNDGGRHRIYYHLMHSISQ